MILAFIILLVMAAGGLISGIALFFTADDDANIVQLSVGLLIVGIISSISLYQVADGMDRLEAFEDPLIELECGHTLKSSEITSDSLRLKRSE